MCYEALRLPVSSRAARFSRTESHTEQDTAFYEKDLKNSEAGKGEVLSEVQEKRQTLQTLSSGRQRTVPT